MSIKKPEKKLPKPGGKSVEKKEDQAPKQKNVDPLVEKAWKLRHREIEKLEENIENLTNKPKREGQTWSGKKVKPIKNQDLSEPLKNHEMLKETVSGKEEKRKSITISQGSKLWSSHYKDEMTTSSTKTKRQPSKSSNLLGEKKYRTQLSLKDNSKTEDSKELLVKETRKLRAPRVQSRLLQAPASFLSRPSLTTGGQLSVHKDKPSVHKDWTKSASSPLRLSKAVSDDKDISVNMGIWEDSEKKRQRSLAKAQVMKLERKTTKKDKGTIKTPDVKVDRRRGVKPRSEPHGRKPYRDSIPKKSIFSGRTKFTMPVRKTAGEKLIDDIPRSKRRVDRQPKYNAKNYKIKTPRQVVRKPVEKRSHSIVRRNRNHKEQNDKVVKHDKRKKSELNQKKPAGQSGNVTSDQQNAEKPTKAEDASRTNGINEKTCETGAKRINIREKKTIVDPIGESQSVFWASGKKDDQIPRNKEDKISRNNLKDKLPENESKIAKNMREGLRRRPRSIAQRAFFGTLEPERNRLDAPRAGRRWHRNPWKKDVVGFSRLTKGQGVIRGRKEMSMGDRERDFRYRGHTQLAPQFFVASKRRNLHRGSSLHGNRTVTQKDAVGSSDHSGTSPFTFTYEEANDFELENIFDVLQKEGSSSSPSQGSGESSSIIFEVGKKDKVTKDIFARVPDQDDKYRKKRKKERWMKRAQDALSQIAYATVFKISYKNFSLALVLLCVFSTGEVFLCDNYCEFLRTTCGWPQSTIMGVSSLRGVYFLLGAALAGFLSVRYNPIWFYYIAAILICVSTLEISASSRDPAEMKHSELLSSFAKRSLATGMVWMASISIVVLSSSMRNRSKSIGLMLASWILGRNYEHTMLLSKYGLPSVSNVKEGESPLIFAQKIQLEGMVLSLILCATAFLVRIVPSDPRKHKDVDNPLYITPQLAAKGDFAAFQTWTFWMTSAGIGALFAAWALYPVLLSSVENAYDEDPLAPSLSSSLCVIGASSAIAVGVVTDFLKYRLRPARLLVIGVFAVWLENLVWIFVPYLGNRLLSLCNGISFALIWVPGLTMIADLYGIMNFSRNLGTVLIFAALCLTYLGFVATRTYSSNITDQSIKCFGARCFSHTVVCCQWVTILGFVLLVCFVPGRFAEVKIEELGVTRVSPVNANVEGLLLNAIEDELLKDGIVATAEAIKQHARKEVKDPQAVLGFFGDVSSEKHSEPVCEADAKMFAEEDDVCALFDIGGS